VVVVDEMEWCRLHDESKGGNSAAGARLRRPFKVWKGVADGSVDLSPQ